MLTHKQIAKREGCSLATAYRRYPILHPQISSAEVRILVNLNYSLRQISGILGMSKEQVARYARR